MLVWEEKETKKQTKCSTPFIVISFVLIVRSISFYDLLLSSVQRWSRNAGARWSACPSKVVDKVGALEHLADSPGHQGWCPPKASWRTHTLTRCARELPHRLQEVGGITGAMKPSSSQSPSWEQEEGKTLLLRREPQHHLGLAAPSWPGKATQVSKATERPRADLSGGFMMYHLVTSWTNYTQLGRQWMMIEDPKHPLTLGESLKT